MVAVIKGDSALFFKQSRKLLVIIPRKKVILKSVILPTTSNTSHGLARGSIAVLARGLVFHQVPRASGDPKGRPLTNEKEISAMISQQVPQWLPFNGEGVLFDFLAQETRDGKTHGLVAMVAEKDIEEVRQESQAFKFSSSEWVLSSTCLFNLLLSLRPEIVRQAQSFLLLDAGAGGVDMCLGRGKEFLFSRYWDSNQGKAENNFLVDEIKRTIDVCTREGSALPPEVIYFLGAEAPAWCEQLSQELNATLEKVTVDKNAGAHGIADDDAVHVLLGALAPRAQPSFDFKPPTVKQEERWRGMKRILGRIVLFLGLTCFLWQAARQIEVDGLVRVNHFLAKKVKQNTPALTRAQKQTAARTAVQNFLAQKIFLNAWLSELCLAMPNALSLEHVELSPDGKWRAKGVGIKENDIQDFARRAQASSVFQNVKVENVRQEKRGSQDVWVFQLSGRINKKGESW